MRRVLVEDVDALAKQLIGRYRQQMLQLPQCIYACGVDVVDLELFRVAGQHVNRHVVDHLQKPGAIGVGLYLLSDNRPGQHRPHVGAGFVADGGDQQVQCLRTDVDKRLVRQVLRVRQDVALVRRDLVEHVDRMADHVVDFDRQMRFQRAQGVGRELVHVVDFEVDGVAHHHAHRHVLHHLVEAEGASNSFAQRHHRPRHGAQFVASLGARHLDTIVAVGEPTHRVRSLREGRNHAPCRGNAQTYQQCAAGDDRQYNHVAQILSGGEGAVDGRVNFQHAAHVTHGPIRFRRVRMRIVATHARLGDHAIRHRDAHDFASAARLLLRVDSIGIGDEVGPGLLLELIEPPLIAQRKWKGAVESDCRVLFRE